MLNKVKYMKVGKKLSFCFTLVVMVASLSGVLGLLALQYSRITYDNALVNNGFAQGKIGIFSSYLNEEPVYLREMVLGHDRAEVEATAQALTEIAAQTDAAFEEMKPYCASKKEEEYVQRIEDLLPAYREVAGRVKKLALENNDDAAVALISTEGKAAKTQLINAVHELINLNVEMGNDSASSLKLQVLVISALIFVVIVVATLLSTRIARYVAKLFEEPITHVKEVSAELAKGNLDIEIEPMYPDEIGEMTESFKEATKMIRLYIKDLARGLGQMAGGNFNISTDVDFRGDFRELEDSLMTIADSLSDTLGKINEASGQVAVGASQMAESAQALAEGATDQASSVQELTATIEDITEAVVDSSEKASQSYIDAENFKKEAEKSNENIAHLNEAMERINDTSKEIANIIVAIEDIASQTNLLSLNASIEAARAGEAGRGFAVVADQIGKLASESANSAISTKKLIEHSIQEINYGNEITAKTTSAIEAVITGITTLAESTKEISVLANSQADAMKQLELGVEQISEVIQSNSAAAEETSATSQELSAQSEALESLVGEFVLKM